jgi:predicted RNA binding protein YcfA (HicA-like mRNA interferase family)
MATSTAGLVSLQQQPSVARLASDTDDEVFKNSADNFTALPEFIFIDTKQRQASPVSTIKSLGDLTKRFPKLDDQAASACTRKVISRSVMERERVLLGIPLFLDSSDQTLLRQAGWTFDHQKGNHQIWYSPKRCRLSVQEGKSGKAKGCQVEQFLIQKLAKTTKIASTG